MDGRVYRRLVATEETHAQFGEGRLQQVGLAVPRRRIGWRTRSLLSLVMGVAGADLSGRAILVTGLAGLLAGACSIVAVC